MTSRIGLGHDIHRISPQGVLVLGGVVVSTDQGFVTHSDGDVLCHALVDAMAGALADGDLGTHFPETDPAADEARSLDFVVEFDAYIRERGWCVQQVDAFVTLGTIRLRPHLADMRTNVAAALDLDETFVSIKARSNDGLGPEGEGLAASATAVVLLEPFSGEVQPAPTQYRRG